MTQQHPPDADRGVYGISVAAELAGTGPQNLRLYESRGLLAPARTDGGTRRYSADDIHRLHRIAALLAEGLNLAGIAMVLDLQDQNAALRSELDPPVERSQATPQASRPRRRRNASAAGGSPRTRG